MRGWLPIGIGILALACSGLNASTAPKPTDPEALLASLPLSDEPGFDLRAANEGPLGEVEERARRLMIDPEFPGSSLGHWADYLRLSSASTEEQWLGDRSWPPETIRLVRNTPYALRGRIFSTPQVARYFETQPWYQPLDDAPDPPVEEGLRAMTLREWEERERERFPLPKALEDRLIEEGFFTLFLTSAEVHWPFAGEHFMHRGELWWCIASDAFPDYPCSGLSLHCPAVGRCGQGTGP